jgi:DNA methylase
MRADALEQLPLGPDQDDVRYPEALVEAFLTEYAEPGDVVLDPFAGLGTSLIVALFWLCVEEVPLG